MKNKTLIILPIFFIFLGCTGFTNTDSISEARLKDRSTNSLFMKHHSTYCLQIGTPILNRYKKVFEEELKEEWNQYANTVDNCQKSDYIISLYIINLDYNPESKNQIYDGMMRRVKLQIRNNYDETIADYSIGELKYLNHASENYLENITFYKTFITTYHSKERIFGVKQ